MKYKVGDRAMYLADDYNGDYVNTEVVVVNILVDTLYECRFFDGDVYSAKEHELGPTKEAAIKDILDNL